MEEFSPNKLPDGWQVVQKPRKASKKAGKKDRYFQDPEGKLWVSWPKVCEHLSGRASG